MKTDKRLKRGLADLSKLFTDSSAGPLPEKSETARFTIEPPEEESLVPPGIPQFVCASFLDSLGAFQSSDLIRSLEILKTSFQETFLLSIAPTSEIRHEASLHSLPTFKHIPCSQFEAMVQPKIASGRLSESISSKKALVVLDSFSKHSLTNPFSVLRTDFLEVLDHGIFIVRSDLNRIQQAYELIKFCLIRNPALRCSILLTGQNAENMWELAYERLNEIISQFLGCDLGFLGWGDGENFELNPDLLLEGSGNARQLSFKSCLGETLYHSVLSE